MVTHLHQRLYAGASMTPAEIAAEGMVATPGAPGEEEGFFMPYQPEVMWLRGDPHLWSHRVAQQYRVRPAVEMVSGASELPNVGPLEPDTRGERPPNNSQEAFVLSLAKCYMRWFLAIAMRQKYSVEGYFDTPVARLRNSGDGRQSVSRITLRPQIRFLPPRIPSARQFAALHEEAYSNAVTGNAVTTRVECEPVAFGS